MSHNNGEQNGKLEASIAGLTSYPLLTTPMNIEDVEGGASVGGTAAAEGAGLERLVTGALRDVLGWNPNVKDAPGLAGALEQAFDLSMSEGHVVSTWRPRSYAVFTDLDGGVTGAQASVYKRSKDAVDQALPLLDGLYSLGQDADSEDVDAIKALIRQHLQQLVGELGRLGGPRVPKVDQTLDLLLGAEPMGNRASGAGAVNQPRQASAPTADEVQGELGRLRAELRLSVDEDTVNTIGEETNQTNYRILADYVIGLRYAWVTNRDFFRRGSDAKPFFGTQLVHLSRQLAVIAESIKEVRFAFGSVLIGPRERDTLEVTPRWLVADDTGQKVPAHDVARHEALILADGNPACWEASDPIFVGEALEWIESFARDEGPQLIKDGGKLGVGISFLPVAQRLKCLAAGLRRPKNWKHLPDNYRAPRVANALAELEKQLATLVRTATPIKHQNLTKEQIGPEPGSSGPAAGSGTTTSTRPTAA